MIRMSAFLFLFCSSFALASVNPVDLEKKINLTLEKKAQVDLELNKADESVRILEAHLREQRKILLQRVRALSYLKNFKWGGLLAVEDPTAFERNVKILSRMNQYDLNLFKEYRTAIKSLAQGRKDLVNFKKELSKLLTSLQQQEKLLNDSEQTRTESLALENRKSLLLYKGQLPRPTDSPLKLNFGSHRDDQNQYAFLIRGLLFEAKPSENVRAVGPGKVIFRDQLPYWGETLIIEHDDNYFSVYAGVQSALAKDQTNTQVQMNDVIAQTKGQEFYFELRHFDNPINPKRWLKEKL